MLSMNTTHQHLLTMAGTIDESCTCRVAPAADALTEERIRLATILGNCERGAFPGSREWTEERSAHAALAAFDAAHPDVIDRILRDHRAEVEACTIPAGGR